MALTHDRVVEMAQALESAAELAHKALVAIKSVIEANSDNAIDWGAVSTPSYIDEDGASGDGSENITGLSYTRIQVANLVGT